MVSERILCPRFVGRAAELEHLLARRRSAGGSHGGTVLIAGEAGIGKSRLVREYHQRLENSAVLFASSGCREFAQRPLDPIADVLSQLERGAPSPFGTPLASKEEQLGAIVAAFDRIAQRRTTLVVLEDLHWADLELIQTLRVLSGNAAHRRLLFVATYRDDEIGTSSRLFSAFAGLVREPSISLLRLEPLPPRELSEFIHQSIDHIVELSPRALMNVRYRCAGNPLFTEELLRYVVDEYRNGSEPSRHSVPFSLRAVICQRLDRCTPEDRRLLAAASVLGRRFRIDVLDEVLNFPIDEQLASWRRLRDMQLVDPSETDPFGYQFRHALTRDFVYGEMLPIEAQRLHAKVAQRLAARPDAAEHAETLAHSFLEAGLPEQAAPYCEAAGNAARRLHAHEDAALWYERAASAFAGRDADVARVLSNAVQALIFADATDQALQLFEPAVAAHMQCNDILAAVNLTLSMAGAVMNDGNTVDAVGLLKRTLEIDSVSASSHFKHRILVRMSAMYAAQRTVDDALAWIEQVDEGALDPDSRVTAEYYLVKSSIHAQRFERELWRRCFTRSLYLFKSMAAIAERDKAVLKVAHGSIAVQALNLGEMDLAREHQLANLELAQQIRIDERYGLAALAEIELRAGRLEAARNVLAKIDAPREFLPRHQRTLVGTLLATALGDDQLLAGFIDLSQIEEAERGGNLFAVAQLACAFGQGLVRLCRAEEAAPLLERAAEAIRAPFGMTVQIAAIAALRPSWSRRLLRIVAADGLAPPDIACAALYHLVSAAAARDSGDHRSAQISALTGACQFNAIGWPLLEAQSFELAGDHRRALSIYRRTGALGEVRRLERRAIAQTQEHAVARLLSRREHELAQLIAAGKDNRAAADTLSVSKKTVEKYLTSIYAKLGLTSRAQLAAFVVSALNKDDTTSHH